MARGKGGLGRGLDSLFEDAAPVFESGAKVDTLPLREIEPDPEQPRKTFDEQALGELAASIAEHGLLQPIAVRPRPRGGYSIVAGERRWRACRMAKMLGLTPYPLHAKTNLKSLPKNLCREFLAILKFLLFTRKE